MAMVNNDPKIQTNDSIRSVAAFIGGVASALLSFTHTIYSNRANKDDKVSDDVTDIFLFFALISSLSVAALRRPGENTRITNFILNLSFLALLVGTMIFIWANSKRVVGICVTVAVGLLALAYMTITDQDDDRLWDTIARHWRKYRDI